ncbi:MAG TPA: HNH endonuclease [Streptosporangiaceae bacterium]|nr:HNH endonuclease [Streptosporangiaceae bacterium]
MFVTICPKCRRKRLLKANPGRRRDTVCTSCLRTGKGYPKFTLPAAARDRYLAGTSAAVLARELDTEPGTILRALRREGVPCRSMSDAVKLLSNVNAARTRAEELRATGEMAKRLSAGHQRIPLADWDGFRKDHWVRVRNTKEWAGWRTQVYARDGYRCLICNAAKTRANPLEPHHIWKKSLHPERIFDVSNGATLCSSCHREVTGQEEEWAPVLEAMLARYAQPRCVT